MKTLSWIGAGLLWATVTQAELKKEFPAHWGKPPEIQTQDYVALPAGYGHGSSTLRHWITANLAKDPPPQPAAGTPGVVLYTNDFEQVMVGAVPEEMMILGGDFLVTSADTNRFLELPGAPLDSFAVQFGPGAKENIAVSARIFGTAKGRRAPTFGVGLGGVSGWKLQVSPGKKTVELLRDQELKASVPFEWKPGTWTHLRLEIATTPEARWIVTGTAGTAAEAAPKATLISAPETDEPVSGRASVLGSPFAGTPIWFDDLKVEQTR